MKELLQEKIHQKELLTPDQVQIIEPFQGIDPQIQAGWMIQLLEQMYVKHGITQHTDAVIESISTGETQTWFALEDGNPIACAALIHKENEVELGRAAATTQQKGIGGLLMLKAAMHHFTNSTKKLSAEVRVSEEFKGIPSGVATQKLSLRDIGLLPHSLVPMFGHGEPFRQEMFLLSCSHLLEQSQTMFLPNSNNHQLLEKTVVTLAKSVLANPEVSFVSGSWQRSQHWEIKQTAPFSLIAPSRGNSALESVITEVEDHSPFCLAPIEARPDAIGQMKELIDAGFIATGIGSQLGPNGHPEILFGRLKSQTELAPMALVQEIFSPSQRQAIECINHQFRQTV